MTFKSSHALYKKQAKISPGPKYKDQGHYFYTWSDNTLKQCNLKKKTLRIAKSAIL